MTPTLRPMRTSDIPAILAIQAEAYSDMLLESAEVIALRLQASPELA